MFKFSGLLCCAALLLSGVAHGDEIHDLADAGDLAAVQALVGHSPELLDQPNDRGNTPLHIAVSSGHTELIRWLIDQGADLTTANTRGSTCLHLAASAGHVELVEFFLDQGFDIEARNNGGFTPLLHACYSGHMPAATLLLSRSASLKATDDRWGGAAIHWACTRSSDSVRQLLVNHGADLNMPCVTDSSTPIYWAAFNGNAEAARFLIANGVDPNHAMEDGWTPLHNAARNGHTDVIQVFLDQGVAPNVTGPQGRSPILAAAEFGHLETVQFFIERGIDVNVADDHGMNTLHWAVLNGSPELIQLVIDHGGDVNSRDSSGFAPLARFAWAGEMAAARVLVAAGADINSVDREGLSGLARAVRQGNDSLASLLIEFGAHLDVADSVHGRTCLHWAAMNGRVDMTRQLLTAGADAMVADLHGQTPVKYATKYARPAVTDLLVAAGCPRPDNVAYDSDPLSLSLSEGQAAVWYLGHCGFAIKTAKRVLIFDYWNNGGPSDNPCLANGSINPDELKNFPVSVFVSHDHQDHLDDSLFTWRREVPNINYYLGFQPESTDVVCEFFEGRQVRDYGDMQITTITANDAGVGFVVEVDGLTIFHAGDHAGWREGEREGFVSEIDYLASRFDKIDLAFLNVTGCHVSDTVALKESILYTLNKLSPRYWFPTHGLNREHVYQEFADKIAAAGATAEAICPSHKGDRFLFRGEHAL